MPLIILSGYPCSGLTHRANQLAAHFSEIQETLVSSDPPVLKNRYKIHVIPVHDASHPRTVYDHARTEKETRGVAYTRARRALGKDSIVILDGMNYIKGYRYQLWCEAKECGTTSCVVHVGTPVDQCVKNNEERIRKQETTQAEESNTENGASSPSKDADNDQDPYPPELLDNLIFRYEEPSTHSRWDKPLFTIPWTDAEPPVADIWTALTGLPHPSTPTESTPPTPPIANITSSLASTQLSDTASIATGRTGTTIGARRGVPGRPEVRQHKVTIKPVATGSNELYNLEKRTSAIVTCIRNFTLANPSAGAALAQSPDARGISIEVPEASTRIFIPAHVATTGTTDELAGAGGILALPKLQRLRRQWIGLNRAYIGGNYGGVGGGGIKSDEAPDAFVRFLNAEFAGEDLEE